MKSVGLQFEEKLGALADTNYYLNSKGDSHVYMFDIPAAVNKFFMDEVDDAVELPLFRVRALVRMYTNVYGEK